MSAAAQPRMTVDEFIARAIEQPEHLRFELERGQVVAIAPERVGNVRSKQRISRLLADAIHSASLPCEAFVDGIGVQIDETTLYEPDALVRCGAPLADDAIRIGDPLIVVEVLSASSRHRDGSTKLVGYFRIPSLRHYLIVASDIRTVIHHARGEDGTILTRIVRDGPITLDPPGIVLDHVFPPEPER